MLSGFAIRHKIVAGGARQIVAVHMKGDLVDLQNSFLGTADHSVQVLTPCEVAFIPRKVAGLGEASEYEMPMTQEQIADCTGLTPVHVNRTLKMLEAENLITRHSPRTVTIGDWRKLAEAGDFDSNYLHLREQEAAWH